MLISWNALLWLMLLVSFIAVEAGTVGLVSLWFAAGSLSALLAMMLGAGIGIQIFVFIAVSTVLLLLLRPMVRKYITPKIIATNADAVIGKTGAVITAVDNVAAAGQVKLGGMAWSARSSSGDPIPEGTLVTVDRIEGVKVYVTPVKVPEEVQ